MSQADLCVIICSINPSLAHEAASNFEQTSGIALEIQIIDNRRQGLPIASVYNQGASRTGARYLLFIHEDVRFLSDGWGKILIDKLSDPQTGIIGFAGSAFWFPSTGAWWSVPAKFHRCNYRQIENNAEKEHILPQNRHSEDFLPVVSLDGVAMAVRRDVWAQYPFDESVLKWFHCYDIDFSVEISRHYTNYVSYGIKLFHFSNGKYDSRWFEASDYIFRKKWISQESVAVVPVNRKEAKLSKTAFHYDYLFRAIRSDRSDKEVKHLLGEYMRRNGRDLGSSGKTFALLWQYLIKRGFRNKRR